MKGLILFVTALVGLLLANRAEAFCCSAASGVYCGDCTRATPCCATGACNIFCCNCDGSCRTGSCRRRRSLLELWPSPNAPGESGVDIVHGADLDGDGRLNYTEAIHYVNKRSAHYSVMTEDIFANMDTDNDKYLSLAEIDSSP